MTNQPATPRQSRATRAPKREILFHRSRFSFPLPHHLKRNGYANRKRNTLHRLLHPEGRGGQDDPDGAGGQLHYVKGLNVAVVDCDYPQHSIAEMRKRDLKTVMEDEHYKAMAYRQLQRIGKKAYPVIEGTAEDAVEKAEGLLERLPGTDIVFFDLPGTVNSGGVLRTLANMDYIFSPIAADRVVMESTLRFATKLKDTLMDTGKTNIKGLYLLWNMVDGREKSELYGVYEEIIRELGLDVLDTSASGSGAN